MSPLGTNDAVATRARRAVIAVSSVCVVLTTACDLSPFFLDQRFGALGRQMDEAAMLDAAERAVDVFDASAPLTGGAALGTRRIAVGTRLISSNGRRPDLATVTASSDDDGSHVLGTAGGDGQTIAVEAAVRLLPGFRVRSASQRVLGLDALTRVARSSAPVSGSQANDVVVSWGGRLGLLADSAGRSGLSLSIEGARLPVATYDATLTAIAPVTAVRVGMGVSEVRATAFRLQGSATRGEWGLTGALGSTNGSYVVSRRAQLTYADSTSLAEDVHGDAWVRSTASVGLIRRLGRADVTVQYGFSSRPSRGNETALRINAASRHSVSLGAQVRY